MKTNIFDQLISHRLPLVAAVARSGAKLRPRFAEELAVVHRVTAPSYWWWLTVPMVGCLPIMIAKN